MELNDFLLSPVPVVKDLAERSQRIIKLHEEKQISTTEYIELLNDLTDLEKINEDMVDLQAVKEFWDLMDLLKNLKFIATII